MGTKSSSPEGHDYMVNQASMDLIGPIMGELAAGRIDLPHFVQLVTEAVADIR